MIKSKIKEFARSRELSEPQFQRATGLPDSLVMRLWDGDLSRLTVAALDRICEALECQPADLLIYEQGKAVPPSRRAPRRSFITDF